MFLREVLYLFLYATMSAQDHPSFLAIGMSTFTFNL